MRQVVETHRESHFSNRAIRPDQHPTRAADTQIVDVICKAFATGAAEESAERGGAHVCHRRQLVQAQTLHIPFIDVVAAIVTNETNLDARQIVSIYQLRWNIEVLFKELEVDLGLGDYQVLSEEGILKHLHLCCLAHLTLTHHAMEGVGAQARKANKTVRLPTMNQRLEALRSDIRREQIQKMFRQRGSHERVRQKIEQYLRAT